GMWRRVHDAAGPLAIAFVTVATLFSLMTQAFVIGATASTVSGELGIAPGLLLIALLPHALLELWALFLPLAAWLLASRGARWDELLAATVVTVAIAVPTLVLASLVEVYLSPHLLAALLR
ncbi:MAG TPA: stage II sporulation protein M, partial [Conexibacter sp.]